MSLFFNIIFLANPSESPRVNDRDVAVCWTVYLTKVLIALWQDTHHPIGYLYIVGSRQ